MDAARSFSVENALDLQHIKVEDLDLSPEELEAINQAFMDYYGPIVEATATRVLKEYRIVNGILNRSNLYTLDDLRNEMILAVLRRAPYIMIKKPIDESRNVSNYFYTYMRNRLIDIYRDVCNDRPVCSLEHAEYVPSPEDDITYRYAELEDISGLLLARIQLLECLLVRADQKAKSGYYERYVALWSQMKEDHTNGHPFEIDKYINQIA